MLNHNVHQSNTNIWLKEVHCSSRLIVVLRKLYEKKGEKVSYCPMGADICLQM